MKRPSRVESDFTHQDLRCVVLGLNHGHRCGYVGVPKDHPLYGADMTNSRATELRVHGGVTYAASSKDHPVPGHGGLWWFGFDCMHGGDRNDPALMRREIANFEAKMAQELGTKPHGVIRTKRYVETECKNLAQQLVETARATI